MTCSFVRSFVSFRFVWNCKVQSYSNRKSIELTTKPNQTIESIDLILFGEFCSFNFCIWQYRVLLTITFIHITTSWKYQPKTYIPCIGIFNLFFNFTKVNITMLKGINLNIELCFLEFDFLVLFFFTLLYFSITWAWIHFNPSFFLIVCLFLFDHKS